MIKTCQQIVFIKNDCLPKDTEGHTPDLTLICINVLKKSFKHLTCSEESGGQNALV